jgi:hypothetical protein
LVNTILNQTEITEYKYDRIIEEKVLLITYKCFAGTFFDGTIAKGQNLKEYCGVFSPVE